MRNTRSQRGNRRSQINLKRSALISCPECGSGKAPHRMCDNCGKYKSRVVVDVYSEMAKKEAKKKEGSEEENSPKGKEEKKAK